MPVRRKGFSEPEKLYTQAHATNAYFFAVVPAMETAQIAGVRPAFEITHLTGAVLIVPAFQLSDDGETWDNSGTCTAIPNVTAQGSENVYYHTAFEAPTLGKKFVRWGFKIVNNGGSATLLAQAALRLEFKRC